MCSECDFEKGRKNDPFTEDLDRSDKRKKLLLRELDQAVKSQDFVYIKELAEALIKIDSLN